MDALDDFLDHAKQAAILLATRSETPTLAADLAAEAVVIRLGESVKRAGKRFATDHPELDFSIIAGARDVAAHGYDIVEPGTFWQSFEYELPHTVQKLNELLK